MPKLPLLILQQANLLNNRSFNNKATGEQAYNLVYLGSKHFPKTEHFHFPKYIAVLQQYKTKHKYTETRYVPEPKYWISPPSNF